MSWKAVFANVAAAHGVATGVQRKLKEYIEWCDVHPEGGGCASTKKMDKFFHETLGYGLREAAGASRGAASSSPSAILAAPTAFGTKLSVKKKLTMRGNKAVLEGTDLVAMLSTPGTVLGIGAHLADVQLQMDNPIFHNTRVQWLAQGYEKWRLEMIEFFYQPTCPSSTGGAMCMAWDNDPADPIVPATIDGVKQLFSYESNTTTTVWSPTALNCKLHPSTTSLFTSSSLGDQRLFSAGQLQCVVTAPPPINTAIGVLWMKYRIAFESPSELLAAGPDDAYYVAGRVGALGYTAGGGSILSQIIAVSPSNVNGMGVRVNPSSGRVNVELPPGIWLCETMLLNQTTAVAITLNVSVTTFSGANGIIAGAIVDTSTPASNGSALYHRMAVLVASGSSGYESSISADGTFSNAIIRVRDMSATPPVTQAMVDDYPF